MTDSPGTSASFPHPPVLPGRGRADRLPADAGGRSTTVAGTGRPPWLPGVGCANLATRIPKIIFRELFPKYQDYLRYFFFLA